MADLSDLGGLLGIDPAQWTALLAQLQPSEAEQKAAQREALRATGLGILSGRGGLGRSLGQGGLLGMNAYQDALAQGQKQRLQALQMAPMLQGLAGEQTYQKWLQGQQQALPTVPQGAGQSPGAQMPTPGMAPPGGPPRFARF